MRWPSGLRVPGWVWKIAGVALLVFASWAWIYGVDVWAEFQAWVARSFLTKNAQVTSEEIRLQNSVIAESQRRLADLNVQLARRNAEADKWRAVAEAALKDERAALIRADALAKEVEQLRRRARDVADKDVGPGILDVLVRLRARVPPPGAGAGSPASAP